MKNGPITIKQIWTAIRCDAGDDDDSIEIRCDSCGLNVRIKYDGKEVSVCHAVRDVLHRADYECRRICLQKKYEERVARREVRAR
jgi:hypothetical protein